MTTRSSTGVAAKLRCGGHVACKQRATDAPVCRFLQSTTTMSSASIQTLPEELLREILSYIFHLSPESFCGSRTRWHSLAQPVPYYQRRSTCQDLILVCKSWLRIATPLLYESLAVRTPEHVATVATLLKATPSLGRAVKQLKVFGGYGKDMGILASTCPNVDTLYVYVSVKSDASIVGIKKVLLALSPTRLYLEEYRAYSNKKVDELHQLIGTQFTKWAHLVSSMPLSQKSLGIRYRLSVYYMTLLRHLKPNITLLYRASTLSH